MSEPAREIDPKYLPWHVERGCSMDWEVQRDGVLVGLSFYDCGNGVALLLKAVSGPAYSVRLDDPALARALFDAIFRSPSK